MNLEPRLRATLSADARAHARREDLGAAAGDGALAGVPETIEDVGEPQPGHLAIVWISEAVKKCGVTWGTACASRAPASVVVEGSAGLWPPCSSTVVAPLRRRDSTFASTSSTVSVHASRSPGLR